MSQFDKIFSEENPITRSFEHDGKRYLHGYGCRFDTPDNHGTIMTREVVEASIESLKKYPAVRYMHYKPFARILFDVEVDGIRTYVSDKGFYILAEVYPDTETEWNMIKKGHWGLSWGMAPTGVETELRYASDGKMYPHFVKGLIREISVVDAPSHLDCVAIAIQRAFMNLNSDETKGKKMYTMRNFEAYEIDENGKLSIIEDDEE